MTYAPAGLSDRDWEATPPAVKALVMRLIAQGEALSARVAQLEEQKGRSSRNSSKPPSSDGAGFKPPAKEKSKGSGRKRGGQDGHPGANRVLLPADQCADVIPHYPTTCRGCGEALSGEDPEPYRHQVVDIPKIVPFVIEHQLHRLICPHCHTSTCAELPEGVEKGNFGSQLSAYVGILGGVYHLSHRKVRSLLDHFLGVEISTGAINTIRYRLSECLATLVEEAAAAIREEKVAHMDETGGPIGNADGNNPERKRGWLWVMVTPALAVFHLALSRSAEVAKQLLGEAFNGIVVTDRYGAYSWLPLHRRQICWAHIKRDFTAIAERTGGSAQVGKRLLDLEQQLFHQWHRWRERQISRQELQAITTPIRQAIETTLKEVSDLGFTKGEKSSWASTVRSCRQILKVAPALWTFLDHPDVEPTNNAAERALRPAVIHRKLSYGVQSQSGSLCQSRLLTVTTTLKQQKRDVMAFLVEAWEAHNNGLPAPSLLPQRD
ncbi:MAG: IS66 family transposase [Cyanobium sp.]